DSDRASAASRTKLAQPASGLDCFPDVGLQGVRKEAENVEQRRFPATIRSQDHAHGLQVVECDVFQDPVVLNDQLLDMGHGEITFRRCNHQQVTRSGKGGSGDAMLNSSELEAVFPEFAVFLFALIRNGLAMGQY